MNFYERVASAFSWMRGASKAKGSTDVLTTTKMKETGAPEADVQQPSAFTPMRLNEGHRDLGETTKKSPGATAPESSISEGNLPRDGDDDAFFTFLLGSIDGGHEEFLGEISRSDISLSGHSKRQAPLPIPADAADRSVEDDKDSEVKSLTNTPLKVSGWEDVALSGLGRGSSPSWTIYKSDSSSAARSLRDYELLAYIGKGTFAEVTLARHRETHTFYAVKKISKKKVWDEDCVQCTFTERHLLASFKHPFLVNLHQAFQSQSCLYLVLDFAQGGDLYVFLETKPWIREMRRKLHRGAGFNQRKGSGLADSKVIVSESPLRQPPSPGRFSSMRFAPDDSRTPIRIIVFCAIEIALVLQYLHTQGFVYRDLKPENVLMTSDGNVVLADFGVAKYRGVPGAGGTIDSGTRTDFHAGTSLYMSPEVLLGEAHDSRIDWWSFGCMLFEMANGRRPFDANNRYDIMKSIVETDVQLQPGDFMITELELAARVAQLTCQYEEEYGTHRPFRGSLVERGDGRQHATAPWPGGDSAGQPLRPSGPALWTFPLPDLVEHSEVTEKTLSVYDTATCFEETWSAPSGERANASSTEHHPLPVGSVSLESSDAFTEHATEELTEACTLLKDLILALLQRSPEKRLCGERVLEHPFFLCPYATSQLYCTRKTSIVSCGQRNSGGSTLSCNATSCLPHVSDATDTTLDQAFPLMGLPLASFRSLRRASVASRSCRSDTKGTSDPEVVRPPGAPFAQDFLHRFPIQRPAEWRELFLSGGIKPPYVPRLRAADDLRYFPHAVTATGKRVADQQRGLRKRHSRYNDLRTNSARSRLVEQSASVSFSTEGARAFPLDIVPGGVEEEEEFKGMKESSHTPLVCPRERLVLSAISECNTTPEPDFGEEEETNEPNCEPKLGRRIDFFGSVSAPQTPNAVTSTSAEGFPSEPYKRKDMGHSSGPSAEDVRTPEQMAMEWVEDRIRNGFSTSTVALGSPLGTTVNVGSHVDGGEDNQRPVCTPTKCETKLAEEVQQVGEEGQRRSVRGVCLSPKFNASVASSSSRTTYSTSATECGKATEMVYHPAAELPDTLTGVAYDVDDYVPSRSKKRGAVLLNRTGIPPHNSLGRCVAEEICQRTSSPTVGHHSRRPPPVGHQPVATRRVLSQSHQAGGELASTDIRSPILAGYLNRESRQYDDFNSNRSSVASHNFITQGSEFCLPFCATLGSGQNSDSNAENSVSHKMESTEFTGANTALPHFMDFTFNSHSGGARLLGSLEGVGNT
ncbi:AGC/RSK family serine/threonine kinase, putative [Trypanosoma equiperdum]|uniref:non-specific serine/threonine protein kinase n=2 Tax=Trypanozoon TaxID=39700 RepID=Q582Y1_TRYB2|nr:serine/threonine-protein kinase, putative [Trypanosoma brucei brucei TREU927]AAX80708.1 serine/threonine-protein kinase, putative [Trypanosoma brucei]AAZ10303.1 serine/threonine-protein kinase, putative [Trypanosoma brucei brucei TREU927]SCU64613.1 AGC/RSK family serine/threonine kinase, putative [Trypanosoma equiperdum]